VLPSERADPPGHHTGAPPHSITIAPSHDDAFVVRALYLAFFQPKQNELEAPEAGMAALPVSAGGRHRAVLPIDRSAHRSQQ
jgi:hypothetical protein